MRPIGCDFRGTTLRRMRRRRAKEIETGAEGLEVHDAKAAAAGSDRGRGRPEAQCRADGPGAQRAYAAQAQPGRRFRLHELRLARPGARAPAHRGVLRERRQGGRRGGDQGPGHAGVLRPAQHRRAGRPVRALARPAGPDHPPDGQAAGRHPLRADRLGRGVRADRATSSTRLDQPDEAIFYTSGRTSNEAAFAYQLFVRAYGTNNLPDCSNMCHESTSVALAETIGIGKGSVTLDDIYNARAADPGRPEPGHQPPADAVRAGDRQAARGQDHRDQPAARGRAGQLPQPAEAARRGRRRAPTWPTCTCRSGSTATWRCSRRSARCCWSGARSTTSSSAATPAASRPGATTSAGWTGTQVERGDRTVAGADHRGGPDAPRLRPHGLLLGDGADPAPQRGGHDPRGRQPGAGPGQHRQARRRAVPVRGHSNVQGDRTMGIWERPPQHFLDALQAEFGFDPPREHGYDTVDAIRALRDGQAQRLRRAGRQLRPGRARHRGDRRRAARTRADRAGVDQAQPLAPGHAARPR